MQPLPDASGLPVPEPPPAGRPAAAAQLPRRQSPRAAGPKDEDDASDGDAARYPHCGAKGRYVYRFTADAGREHGAMHGCFARFPKHRFAERAAKILAKEKDNKRKGWKLASWDQRALDAIRDFTAGRIQEWQADDIIREADKAACMKRRGYR